MEALAGFRPDQIASHSYQLVAHMLGIDEAHFTFESMGLDTAVDQGGTYGYFSFGQLTAALNEHHPSAGVVQLSHHDGTVAAEDAKPIYRLGGDPVDKDGFRPDDLRDSKRNPDLKANLDKAADALANEDTSMPPEKLAAIKAGMTSPDGWREMKAGDLDGKPVIMSNGEKGGFGAEKRIVKLPPDTVVYAKEVEYTVDGKTYKETIYIPKDCANLSIDANADTPVETEVAPEVPKPPVSYQVDPYHLACGEIKSLVIADIVLPNADINSPESQAAIARAIAEIKAAQGAAGDSFHDFTAIRIHGPDGKVIEVACLEEGSSERSEWRYIDAQGKKVLITPENVKEVIDGTLDNHGDGLVAPTMDAQYKDGKFTFTLQGEDEWQSAQMENIRSDSSVSAELFNRMLGTPVPADFFDWSFEKRVRWLQETFNISRESARDFANYLGSYTGDYGNGPAVIHIPKSVQVTPHDGDTFGALLNRATQSHYRDLKGSIS